jgi:pilus assembly protein CpaE
MDSRRIRCAVITTDDDFRGSLLGPLSDACSIDVCHEIAKPVNLITTSVVEELLAAGPEVVFLDVSAAPAPSLKLAQYLVDADPSWCVVAIGGEPTPEIVLAALRVGVAEYLDKPVSANDLLSALERISKRIARAPELLQVRTPQSSAADITAIVPACSGSGATTLAVSMATLLAERGAGRVLLVDLDMEMGDVALHLGVSPRFDIVDLVRNSHRLDAGMISSMTEKMPAGFELLAAPEDPRKGQGILPEQVLQTLRVLRRHYSHIVLDCASPLAAIAAQVPDLATRVLYVSAPDVASLYHARRLLPVLQRATSADSVIFSFVLYGVRPEDSPSDEEVRRAVGVAVAGRVREDATAAFRALTAAEPLVASRSNAARDIEALLVRHAAVPPAPAKTSAGMFGRFGRSRA